MENYSSSYLQSTAQNYVKAANSATLYKDLAKWIGRTYPLFILLIGTVGNVLNYIVLGRTCPGTSIGVLLRAISIGNLMDIWFYISYVWMNYTFNFNIRLTTNFVCKSFPYLSYVGADFSIFLVVISSLDRLIAVWLPLKFTKFCNVKMAVIETIILGIVSLLLNVTTLFTRTILPDGTCEFENNWLYYFQTTIQPWIVFIFVSLVPEASVIILNILIVAGLAEHKRRMKHMISANANKAANKIENSTYVLTIGMSVMFIILYTPILLLNIFEFQFTDKNFYRLLSTIFSMMQHTHHFIDFYMYLLISDSFRQKFMKGLCKNSA